MDKELTKEQRLALYLTITQRLDEKLAAHTKRQPVPYTESDLEGVTDQHQLMLLQLCKMYGNARVTRTSDGEHCWELEVGSYPVQTDLNTADASKFLTKAASLLGMIKQMPELAAMPPTARANLMGVLERQGTPHITPALIDSLCEQYESLFGPFKLLDRHADDGHPWVLESPYLGQLRFGSLAQAALFLEARCRTMQDERDEHRKAGLLDGTEISLTEAGMATFERWRESFKIPKERAYPFISCLPSFPGRIGRSDMVELCRIAPIEFGRKRTLAGAKVIPEIPTDYRNGLSVVDYFASLPHGIQSLTWQSPDGKLYSAAANGMTFERQQSNQVYVREHATNTTSLLYEPGEVSTVLSCLALLNQGALTAHRTVWHIDLEAVHKAVMAHLERERILRGRYEMERLSQGGVMPVERLSISPSGLALLKSWASRAGVEGRDWVLESLVMQAMNPSKDLTVRLGDKAFRLAGIHVVRTSIMDAPIYNPKGMPKGNKTGHPFLRQHFVCPALGLTNMTWTATNGETYTLSRHIPLDTSKTVETLMAQEHHTHRAIHFEDTQGFAAIMLDALEETSGRRQGVGTGTLAIMPLVERAIAEQLAES